MNDVECYAWVAIHKKTGLPFSHGYHEPYTTELCDVLKKFPPKEGISILLHAKREGEWSRSWRFWGTAENALKWFNVDWII